MFSLRYKQFLVLLLGAAISCGMFFLTQTVGDFLISKYYLNEKAMSQRLTDYLDSFEQYISRNQTSITSVSTISKWVKKQKDVYLIIYDGDKIVYEAGCWDEKYYAYEIAGSASESSNSVLSDNKTQESDADAYFDLSMRDIKFSDGIYTASIMEFSEIKLYNTVTYISWMIFFFFLFLILIIYNHHTISRILHLSKEVSAIEKGEFDQAICHNGNDEISLLAFNAENMKNSIIARLRSEKEAWEANSELITSMSHDIRTPLTSLIGYLEILNSKNYQSEEQFDKYINSCREKSIQLKDLSDKLFQYFLIFGKEKIAMRMETFDVQILFQQLLFEHVFYLKNLGFPIETEFTEQTCIITADIQYLKRLFDNLFSNVEKYADPNGQIAVSGKITDHDLYVIISNDIRKDNVIVESTNIGLKTCQKIVEQMNGVFEAKSDQSHFEVRVIFPIEKTECK